MGIYSRCFHYTTAAYVYVVYLHVLYVRLCTYQLRVPPLYCCKNDSDIYIYCAYFVCHSPWVGSVTSRLTSASSVLQSRRFLLTSLRGFLRPTRGIPYDGTFFGLIGCVGWRKDISEGNMPNRTMVTFKMSCFFTVILCLITTEVLLVYCEKFKFLRQC